MAYCLEIKKRLFPISFPCQRRKFCPRANTSKMFGFPVSIVPLLHIVLKSNEDCHKLGGNFQIYTLNWRE